jgi:hypothetical protein
VAFNQFRAIIRLRRRRELDDPECENTPLAEVDLKLDRGHPLPIDQPTAITMPVL